MGKREIDELKMKQKDAFKKAQERVQEEKRRRQRIAKVGAIVFHLMPNIEDMEMDEIKQILERKMQ